jgi:O-antigen/teichoic acid export membrane protein
MGQSARLKKIAQDLFHVVVGNGFARGLTLLNSMAVARVLGPEDFGKFSLFYVASVLAWQMPQGFDTTYVRFARGCSDRGAKQEYLKASIAGKAAYVLVALLIAVAGLAIRDAVTASSESYGSLLLSGIVSGCALSFNGSVTVVFQEREQFGRYSLMNNLTSGAFSLALLALWLWPGAFAISNILSAYIAVSIVIGTVSLAVVLAKTGGWSGFRRERFFEVVSFGKWIFGVTILYYLFQRCDVLLLARLLPYGNVGVYSTAAQLAMLVSLLTGSVGAVFMPKAMEATKSRDGLRAYVRAAALPVAAVLFGILALMAFAGPLLTLAFGEQYAAAVPILRILLLGWVFSTIYIPFSYMFYGLDEPQLRFALEAVKLTLVLVALIFLIPWLGPTGAAWGVTGALAAEAVFSGFVLHCRLRARFAQLSAATMGSP